jgi:hypothetical protein
MVNIRNAFRRQDSVAGVSVPQLEHSKPPSFDSDDIQKTHLDDEKEAGLALEPEEVAADGTHKADYLHVAAKDILANGKERPIEVSIFSLFVFSPLSFRADRSLLVPQTAEDISTRCMSLEDDPEMRVHTFRMYFLGIGLTCFAAVLGQVRSFSSLHLHSYSD